MRMSVKKVVRVFVVVGLALACLSCGSASNNDQGVAFTLFGFSKDGSTTNDAGAIVPLSTDYEPVAAEDTSSNFIGDGVVTFLALQNNLLGQGITLQRAFMEYYINGADIQPPPTSISMGGVLGPAESEDSGGTGGDSGASGASGSTTMTGPSSSLPPGFNFPPTRYIQIYIVPPDIMAWLNLNRAYLPELPFVMTVRVYATGMTTSGNRMDTNELDYFINFVPDNMIPPTGGEGNTSSEDSSEDSSAEGETVDDGTGEGTVDDGDVPTTDEGDEGL